MTDDSKPQLTNAQRSLRTFGVFLLVFLGPLLVLRVGCLSHREVCERVGGMYAQHGRIRVCSMPNAEACPAPYHYEHAREGCVNRTSMPGVLRWDAL